jgi:hypothetical protein
MKKKILIVIIITILILSIFFMTNAIKNLNFRNLALNVKKLYNTKTNDIVVAYVNEDPIYKNDVKKSYLVKITLRQEYTEIIKTENNESSKVSTKMN